MATRKSAARRHTKGAEPPPAALLELPVRLTIHEAHALHALLLAHIGPRKLVVDGARVEEVDTAGLQLMLAARRAAAAAGGSFEWRPLPPAVARAARELGLAAELGLGDGP